MDEANANDERQTELYDERRERMNEALAEFMSDWSECSELLSAFIPFAMSSKHSSPESLYAAVDTYVHQPVATDTSRERMSADLAIEFNRKFHVFMQTHNLDATIADIASIAQSVNEMLPTWRWLGWRNEMCLMVRRTPCWPAIMDAGGIHLIVSACSGNLNMAVITLMFY